MTSALGPQLRSERLLLRRWREEDLDPFSALNADPAVMEHFPATLNRDQCSILIERMESCFDANGFGLWALELVGERPSFLGCVGLWPVDLEMPFAPAVELGWRLARKHWGHGYASEAASVAVEFAFGELALPELLAYTAARNLRSRRVMERLGMTHDPAEDFSHPKLDPAHPLAPHVLYRLTSG
jgi:ribosomal-protein-alanine N-acetyltransferase